MLTLLKILTLPIWLPIKILWWISKLIAFVILIVILSMLIYIILHVL
ncbi:MAG: hypothetical protein HY707_06910 [Ignavibacteriae bacterium]|nr:hypothetical protein [Ignavibacteriota bacterium]